MKEETPAEVIARWFRTPSSPQIVLRWLAIAPAVICIALASQLILLFILSFLNVGSTESLNWLANIINAAFVPFLIIVLATPIAPTSRKSASIGLAILALVLVSLSRLASELSHPTITPWREIWLAVSIALCGTSIWFGLRYTHRVK
ncbi:hypothetical protein H8K35_08145 [Undibacterium sp. LX40W]|uniref:hypothetical protein n=1 Tax=Undibacterium sp. LX40W TaxID=2762299 RepID=UPI00164CA51A|nr:hypothetical protein [Undibacterium sp. LX40W]MBC3891622.1 hypothetical protein [Undibacterium sp. LX40W]